MCNVFVISYKSRSGSTYVADLLSKHPAIHVTSETKFLRHLWQWEEQRAVPGVNSEDLDALLDHLYFEDKFSKLGIDRIHLHARLEKHTPLTLDVVSEIIIDIIRNDMNCVVGIKFDGWALEKKEALEIVLPGSRIVHLIRDGRAVYASSKKAIHSEKKVALEQSTVKSALGWSKHARLVDKYSDCTDVLIVNYEDVIRDIHSELKRILHFLEVDESKQVIEGILTCSSDSAIVYDEISHLHPNVGKPPDPARIDAWREALNRREIWLFESVAGKELEKMGYHLVHRTNLRQVVVGFLLKVVGSIELVIRSMKARLRNVLLNRSIRTR